MHEQIFTAALIYNLLQFVLLSWRYVQCVEVPPRGTPPVLAMRPGLAPTRKRKGRYPSGFA